MHWTSTSTFQPEALNNKLQSQGPKEAQSQAQSKCIPPATKWGFRQNFGYLQSEYRQDRGFIQVI